MHTAGTEEEEKKQMKGWWHTQQYQLPSNVELIENAK
jgi:hypothetical protein